MSELHISLDKPERAKVDIDGTEYEIATTDDLSFKQSAYMNYVGNRIQKIMNAEEWSDEGGNELENLLDEATKLVLLGVPDDVFAKLRDTDKLRVINFFSETAQLDVGTDQSSSSEQ